MWNQQLGYKQSSVMHRLNLLTTLFVLLTGSCLASRPADLEIAQASKTVTGNTQNFHRPCVKADLVGTHTLINMGGTLKKTGDTYFSPYQMYWFTTDGKIRHLTSTKPILPSDRAVFEAVPFTSRYTIDQGVIKVFDRTGKQSDQLLCLFLTAAQENRLPGDILLAAGRKNGPVYVRHFRRKK